MHVLDHLVYLSPKLNEKSRTLGGSQQRMLAIAGALMTNPNVLLIDEPSAGISPIVVKQIYHHIDVLKKLSITILLVDQNIQQSNIFNRK
ncbi:MAG: ATP-binding cassette domain-containing protein [Candidatus Caldarchaeum sp.]